MNVREGTVIFEALCLCHGGLLEVEVVCIPDRREVEYVPWGVCCKWGWECKIVG